jgi:hypothetical protein
MKEVFIMGSTLERETNPANGYSPALLPQHEGLDGKFKVTGENNPLPVLIQLIKGMMPTQGQGQLIEYDITHTNVIIPPNSWSAPTTFKETNGATFLAVHLNNDSSATALEAEVAWSNDGNTQDGKTSNVVVTTGAQNRSGVVQVMAPYYRVNIRNSDTAAAPAGNHAANCKVTKLYGA